MPAETQAGPLDVMVTDEMIKAGLRVLFFEYDRDGDIPSEFVRDIYIAMELAGRSPHHEGDLPLQVLS